MAKHTYRQYYIALSLIERFRLSRWGPIHKDECIRAWIGVGDMHRAKHVEKYWASRGLRRWRKNRVDFDMIGFLDSAPVHLLGMCSHITSQLDWGLVWPYRRQGSAIFRRRQQRLVVWVAIGDLPTHHVDTLRARLLSALFLFSSCWDSDGGASVLCVFQPTRSESLSRWQGRVSWRYSVNSGPACLLGSSAPHHTRCSGLTFGGELALRRQGSANPDSTSTTY